MLRMKLLLEGLQDVQVKYLIIDEKNGYKTARLGILQYMGET